MSDQLFERAVRDWLDDGSDRTPRPAIDAVLLAVQTTPQERDLRIPWRFPSMNGLSRAAALTVVLAAVIGAGTIYLIGQGPDVGRRPTEAPTPTSASTTGASPGIAPEPTIDIANTDLWPDFTSARFGYTSKRPPGWEVTPATRDWSLEVDREDWLSPAQDQFLDEQATYEIGLWTFSVEVSPGISAAEWIDAFFAGNSDFSRCPVVPAAELPAITVDGLPGKLADQPACADTMAFVLIEDRMYVFKIGRAGQVPLFEAFLSTVQFPVGG